MEPATILHLPYPFVNLTRDEEYVGNEIPVYSGGKGEQEKIGKVKFSFYVKIQICWDP
jgi:hypothetical protein